MARIMTKNVTQPREILVPVSEYLPALLAEKLNIAVDTAEFIKQVGCVYLFNITPFKKIDPTVIICDKADLSMYYHLWGKWATGQYRYADLSMVSLMGSCDDAIGEARESFYGIKFEFDFLCLELLKWKNEMRKIK